MEQEEINEIKKINEASASVTKIINENNDKLEIGTPAKGGSMRISGDFNKPDEFKKKIDNAIEVRNYASAQIAVNT